jgi:DNA primase
MKLMSKNLKESMNKEIEHLIATNEKALDYFQQELSKSKKALDYLEDRKIREETIKAFKIGYAPEDSLYEWHLSNRLIFPFFDVYGNVIGFTGRTISDEAPKYRNSKESPIFQKSRTLYGLFQSQEKIREFGFGILVEGQVDVLRLFQEGIVNVAGLSGSSFTVDQARLLCRYIDKVIVAFDSDDAGKKAAKKAVVNLQGIGIDVTNIELPEGEDPDSFVLKNGKEEFLKLMEE